MQTDPILETRRVYDAVGHRYDEQTDAFKARVAYPKLRDELTRLLGTLSKKQVLDVGCGSGNLVLKLVEAGAFCEGVDLSSQSIARAKARGFHATEASMLNLPFPDGSFDAVVSFHSFNYIPHEEQARALLEQQRVLWPGGVFLAVCLFSTEEERRELHLPMLGEHFRLYPCSKSRIEALLRDTGFTRIQTEVLECEPSVLEELIEGAKNLDELELLMGSRGKPYGIMVSARAP